MRFNFLLRGIVLFISFHFCVIAFAESDAGGSRPAKTISRYYGRTGIFFDTGVYLGQTKATADPAPLNQWDTSTSLFDFKLGYITDSHFYFGAEYSSRSDDQISADTTSGQSTGVGIGFFQEKGFFVRTFYLFNNSFGNYGAGNGYKVDLGYMMNLTANLFIGFSVSHRQTTFKTNPAIIAFDTWTRKETYPFFNLGFVFN